MPLADRFTDLLTAWSTFGGAVGSILAVVVAYLLLQREIRSRNEEKRDAEAAQARLVIGVVEPQGAINQRIHDARVYLVNHSSSPITEIRFGAALSSNTQRSPERPVLQLGPGQTVVLDWRLDPPIADSGPDILPTWFKASVSFTDANGLRWTRAGIEPPQRVLPVRVKRSRRIK